MYKVSELVGASAARYNILSEPFLLILNGLRKYHHFPQISYCQAPVAGFTLNHLTLECSSAEVGFGKTLQDGVGFNKVGSIVMFAVVHIRHTLPAAPPKYPILLASRTTYAMHVSVWFYQSHS
jgi:hypothetical protein